MRLKIRSVTATQTLREMGKSACNTALLGDWVFESFGGIIQSMGRKREGVDVHDISHDKGNTTIRTEFFFMKCIVLRKAEPQNVKYRTSLLS